MTELRQPERLGDQIDRAAQLVHGRSATAAVGGLLRYLRRHHTVDPGPNYLRGDDRAFLDGLPDPVTVFRGCSRPRVRDTAARGHRDITVPDLVIARTLVPTGALFVAFTERDEVILDPRQLRRAGDQVLRLTRPVTTTWAVPCEGRPGRGEKMRFRYLAALYRFRSDLSHIAAPALGEELLRKMKDDLVGSDDLVAIYIPEGTREDYHPGDRRGRVVGGVRLVPMPTDRTIHDYYYDDWDGSRR